MASPFTEVNFRPPFPLRATRVSIQFVRYLTRHASILQYNLFDISPRFAEFKPLNLPKLNKKFTHAKRKSRQKPPQNAHFCTVFGTSKITPSVPKTPRNPARRTPPQTPPQPRQASRKHPTPHPVASRLDTPPEAVRNPSRGASQTDHHPVPDRPEGPRAPPRQTSQTPRPRRPAAQPSTPSQTSQNTTRSTPDQTVEPSLREVWNPGPAGPGATLRAALRAMPHRSARRAARRAPSIKKTPRSTLLFARAFYIYLFFFIIYIIFYVHHSKSCI